MSRSLQIVLLVLLWASIGCGVKARPSDGDVAIAEVERIAERINQAGSSTIPNNWTLSEKATCVFGEHDTATAPVTATINCLYQFPLSLNGEPVDNTSRWRGIVNYTESGWKLEHIFVAFQFYDSESFEPAGDVIAADLRDQPGLSKVRDMWLSALGGHSTTAIRGDAE